MELAHLVPARRLTETRRVTPPVDTAPRKTLAARLRGLVRAPVLHFFVLGLLGLLAERAHSRAEQPRPSLTVVIPSGITDSEREVRVDAAILIE